MKLTTIILLANFVGLIFNPDPSKILEYLSLNILIYYIPINICVLYTIMGHVGFEVSPLADYVGILLRGSQLNCSLVVNKICTHPPRLAVISDDLIGLGRLTSAKFSSNPLYTESTPLDSKPRS